MRRVLSITLIAVAALLLTSAVFAQDIKWSQPPVQTGTNNGFPVFLGWDERSIFQTQWQVADDWRCSDDRPVTDIHWWGSYNCWLDQTTPTSKPSGFLFSIYSDVAAGPNVPFSHPGELVWSFATDNFSETFVGYDTLGRKLLDSTFKYSVDLPENAFFNQQGSDSICWLSIQAIYPDNVVPEVNQWGWKTRPYIFGDGAVREVSLAPGWEPILWECDNWDMSFELTTNQPVIPEWNSLALAVMGSGLMGVIRRPLRRRK